VTSDADVVIVGAGVSGLTTAVRLAEAGLRVTIVAAGTDDATTSYAAGATWSPYLVEWTDRVRAWSYATLAMLRELAARDGTGIVLRSGIEASPVPVGPPEWHDRLDGFRMLGPDELPDGLAAGWRYVAPVADMPAYLRYLRRRAESAGAVVEIRRIRTFAEVSAPVVVNCAGIGARELAGDAELRAVRGQIVVVENPGITEFFVAETDPPVYFFPQGDLVVLGGTAQDGAGDTVTDPEAARTILARCVRVDPRLHGARIVGHRVGLRPVRPRIRLERDAGVVHNYGHGGAGITLSWGCANEVARLVLQT
jgi:D-amino-acid oxidase